jgi:hypothetical protein
VLPLVPVAPTEPPQLGVPVEEATPPDVEAPEVVPLPEAPLLAVVDVLPAVGELDPEPAVALEPVALLVPLVPLDWPLDDPLPGPPAALDRLMAPSFAPLQPTRVTAPTSANHEDSFTNGPP